jgi:hypothetical protein
MASNGVQRQVGVVGELLVVEQKTSARVELFRF